MSPSAGTGWRRPLCPGAAACSQGGGWEVRPLVLCVLLPSPITWGWGRARSFASSVSVLPVVPDPAGLVAWGWQWQARRPGVRVPAQGTSEVSAVCLGCLLCDCLHVSLLAPVSGFALCPFPRCGGKVTRRDRPFLPLPLAPSHAEPPTARTATSCLAGGVGSVRAACPARAPPGLLGDGGDVGGSSGCPQPLCVGQKLCSIGSMVGVVFVVCGQCPSWHTELVPVPAASAVPVCHLRQNRTCTRWS